MYDHFGFLLDLPHFSISIVAPETIHILYRYHYSICNLHIHIYVYMYGNISIYLYLYLYISISITQGLFEVAVDSSPEWDLNPRPLISVQTL